MSRPDLYRGERRRLRADDLLIARKVDRETRRRIWRAGARGFTSLSLALRRAGLGPELDFPADRALHLLWFRVFPGWDKTPEVIAWGRAVCRQARKAHNRRAQRERMNAHQAEQLRARVAAFGEKDLAR